VAARTLPLFPLPVVLFPGVQLPLHIFEPRYRRLLADCIESDRRFGLIFCPPGTPEHALPTGQVGCVAVIEDTEQLPDGRSNILVTGESRFSLVRFVDSPHPYRVAEVDDYTDVPEPQDTLLELATLVSETFDRVARAATTIANASAPPPDLPDDPALVAFRVASLIDIDAHARQALLTSRSAANRLREIARVLGAVIEPLEQRAQTHTRAKGNGRSRGGGGAQGSGT
jgi:Lon protease-like protein